MPTRTATAHRVLIAEDEPNIAAFVAQGLRAHGFRPTVVADGEQAYFAATSDDYDLVILDIGLPVVDGLTVLRRLRAEHCRVPVIVLTARRSVEDTVDGLDSGANDYVSKPFQFAVLLARVRAQLRDDEPDSGTHALRCGRFVLDVRTRTIHIGHRREELTPREFALAEILFRHGGAVVSREQLRAAGWGRDNPPASNVVDVYVRYLRRKLGDGSVITVRGKGYRLAQDDGAR